MIDDDAEQVLSMLDELSKEVDALLSENERLRALVAELRDALTECAEELACLAPPSRILDVVYERARAAIEKAKEVS